MPAPAHAATEGRQGERKRHGHDGRPYVQEKRVRPGHVSFPAALGEETR